ncbi:MAG: bifunctional DNA-formamidopyrimidine glycosylase/DNA-(apurinic or apyrimidinic site) lyase [Candidatus Vogelbacteria bacterium]|nr:bifunctional DNA-formamidopyrimidine glycosylase/DNA-(apurinic or apyrimidinic site) lyase [Candidatus Vogelbacteria bacterium]
MPELPEVHTIATQLQKELPGKTITEVWLDWPRQIRNQTPSAFKKALGGKRVTKVHRQGKNVLIDFEDGYTLLVHMKMTGHLMYGKWKLNGPEARLPNASGSLASGVAWKSVLGGAFDDPHNRFIHLIFKLSNGYDLAFSDMRKFGRLELMKTSETNKVASLKKLGPDAISKQLNWQTFEKLLLKRENSPIKQVLMNQEIVAGVGNIYADEMLWVANVHPKIKIKDVPRASFKIMFDAMRKIMHKSIELGGDSASDFRNVYGEKGAFQNFHKAYRQTGKKCTRKSCVGIIQRTTIGQRSAHFCSVHQKLTTDE